MAKGEPITVSMAFGISKELIDQVGAIDVTLNCDTNLFIDPLLLSESSDEKFSECANSAYTNHFGRVADLLSASTQDSDLAARSARNLLSFHEISYTHLGYSSGTTGSGFGNLLTDSLTSNAKQAISLGVRDPDLFIALSLFEAGVGPDRISDMTTNIIVSCLADFTLRSCQSIGIETRPFKIGNKSHQLPANPLNPKQPILLVPKDIVRDLPIASDWDSVAQVSKETAEIRDRVTSQIGEIWQAKSRKDKQEVLRHALQSKSAFELLL